MALEALTGHIDVMRETGETIPDPSSLDEVMSKDVRAFNELLRARGVGNIVEPAPTSRR